MSMEALSQIFRWPGRGDYHSFSLLDIEAAQSGCAVFDSSSFCQVTHQIRDRDQGCQGEYERKSNAVGVHHVEETVINVGNRESENENENCDD